MQPQYRNYSGPNQQQQQRSPMAQRRGPMMPNVAPVQTQQQAQEYAQRQREAAELAKRRSQKPVDRNLPEGVEDLVVGNGVEMYNDLREVERKLDAIMMRKRLDISDALQARPKRYGTMRIWISNTVENQPWQVTGMSHDAYDFSSGADPTFRVKIEGRLINASEKDENETKDAEDGEKDKSNGHSGEGEESSEPAAKRRRLETSKTTTNKAKLSHFFRAIKIEFERSPTLQPDNFTSINWERPSIQFESLADLPPSSDFDCLAFERKADEHINISVNLIRDEFPERYKLAPPLAELLDMEEADRKTVLMGIWEYIKANGLQEEVDTRRIRCDARLQQALGVQALYFPQLPQILRNYLFDLPPVSLRYTIRVDKDFHSTDKPQPTIYDVRVPLEDPAEAQLKALSASTKHRDALQQMSRLDDALATTMLHLAQEKAKHSFFTSMSKDPANFVKRWISSQKRDLDVILGAGAWGDEDWQDAAWRTGGVDGPWGSREAAEGVGNYLSRLDRAKPPA